MLTISTDTRRPRISPHVSPSLTFYVNQHPIRLHAQEPAPPSSGAGTTAHAAIVLLHGSGGNLDFWTSRFAPALQQAGIALYAPHYFDRTATTRADLATISDGVHVPQWLATADAALRFVSSRPGVDPTRIVLAGISLGAFLTLALAAQLSASNDAAQRSRLRAVVEISGGLVDPYRAAATRHFPPTLILHGATDELVPVRYAEDLDNTLTTLDVAHRTEILANEGHWFTAAALPRMLTSLSHFLEEHLAPASTSRPM